MIVKSMAAALASPDRFNIVHQGVFWEIHDNVAHRTVEMFGDFHEATKAYAALLNPEQNK